MKRQCSNCKFYRFRWWRWGWRRQACICDGRYNWWAVRHSHREHECAKWEAK